MIHEGHRKRLKEKFSKGGVEVLQLHEILELVLFYAIPRRNTNVIAHTLMNKFGSISAVFDAPIKVLKEVPGITDSVAFFIKLVPEICRIYLEDKFSQKKETFDLEAASKLLTMKFIGCTEELVAVMLFDAKGKSVYSGIVSKGSVNSVDICARKILELISNYLACGILLAHNHPSGNAIPSRDDISTTRMLSTLFKSIKIEFLDHIIVAENDYVSLRESKIPGIF